MQSNARAVSLAAVVAFSGVGAARGQFYLTGYATGTEESRVQGLSADGRTAAGYSVRYQGGYVAPGFTWSATEGRSDFGNSSGMPGITFAFGISGDGTTIVGGTSATAAGNRTAYRYRGPGTFQSLGVLSGYQVCDARGVSGNGDTVVGGAGVRSDAFAQAFRWTDAGGMQGLGFARPGQWYSYATAISRDGGTIVGFSYGGSEDAFVWTQATGMQALRGIGGADARAFAVNNTGTLVCGDSRFGNQTHAVLWTNGLAQDLGVTTGMIRSYAHAVNDLGSVVVGTQESAFGFNEAFVWTPSGGMKLLSAYLAENGVSVPPAWTFLDCTSISADGRTIGGFGAFDTDGYPQAFVVTIPGPCSLICVGIWAISNRRRR